MICYGEKQSKRGDSELQLEITWLAKRVVFEETPKEKSKSCGLVGEGGTANAKSLRQRVCRHALGEARKPSWLSVSSVEQGRTA